MSKIIVFSIVIASIIVGIGLLSLYLQSFHAVINFLGMLGFNNPSSFTETFYGSNRLNFILASSVVLLFGIVGAYYRNRLIWFTEILLDDFNNKFNFLKKYIVEVFAKETKLHSFLLLFILIIGVFNRVLHLHHPFRYDEAFTLYSYVKSPLLFSIANYSYPNNHIFHNILVQVSTSFFGDSLAAIRLPAFLSGILLLPLFYAFVRKLYNKNIGLISTSILACSVPMINYSVNARGYTLVCLLFMLLLCFALKKNRTYADKFWIILLSGLGFYTVPVFLYPFTIFLLWIFLKEGKIAINELVIYCFGTVILSLVLYTPVFLYTGLDSLINNPYIVKYNIIEMPQFIFSKFFSLFQWFLNGYGLSIFVLCSLGLIVGAFLKNKKANLLLASSIISIAILMFAHRVVPPNRTLIFVLLVLIPIVINGLLFWVKRERLYLIIGFFIVVVLSIYLNKDRYLLSKDKSIFEYDKIALEIIDILKTDDALYATLPVDYPFQYYLEKYNSPVCFIHVNNGGFPSNLLEFNNVYVMIDKRYNKSPHEIYKLMDLNYVLLKDYNYIELYKLIK